MLFDFEFHKHNFVLCDSYFIEKTQSVIRSRDSCARSMKAAHISQIQIYQLNLLKKDSHFVCPTEANSEIDRRKFKLNLI